eukprot:2747803-Rhodomonas_salina.1
MTAPRPIDFSIPQGRIGAPKRKGEVVITEKPRVVLQEGELRVKVTGAASGPQEIAFPANGSVKTLHEKVTSIVGAECLQKLLLGGSLLSEQAAGSAEKNNEEKTLESIGATPGSTVFAICTTKEEIKEIEDQDSGLTKFDGRRTFEQEAELERRRERAKPMYARKAEGSLQDYSFGFANITPLQVGLASAPSPQCICPSVCIADATLVLRSGGSQHRTKIHHTAARRRAEAAGEARQRSWHPGCDEEVSVARRIAD